jgi:hypothetical protein
MYLTKTVVQAKAFIYSCMSSEVLWLFPLMVTFYKKSKNIRISDHLE